MLSDQKCLANPKKEKTNCQVTQVLHIDMQLKASIDIEGITFEISKEMGKHSLFRNIHTIAISPEC